MWHYVSKLFLIIIILCGCCNELVFVTFCLFQDPVKDGEAKIKAYYEELYDEMQNAFHNLEEWLLRSIVSICCVVWKRWREIILCGWNLLNIVVIVFKI